MKSRHVTAAVRAVALKDKFTFKAEMDDEARNFMFGHSDQGGMIPFRHSGARALRVNPESGDCGTRFSDVQMHIGVRATALPNDEREIQPRSCWIALRTAGRSDMRL